MHSQIPFCDLLKALRKEHHLSQAMLAEKLACGRTHIARLETGKSKPSKILLRLIQSNFVLSQDQTDILNQVEQQIDASRMKLKI